MYLENRITQLLKIQFPIIQAGMVWASGWRLAAAVSNAGGLGVLGAGSMYPSVLKEQIKKCKAATNKPFGVNLPLLYTDIPSHLETIIEEKISVVFTSAGNPKTYTSLFKQNGITVIHVVSSSTFAKKAQDAGCDAVVAEGFEAGGHNGKEETTTFVLIPAVVNSIHIPVIAAGGIATGRQMYAAMVLGAEGVQLGSRFVACTESSAHDNFKHKVINTPEGGTQLALKKLTPVRLIKNNFFAQINEAEQRGADEDELKNILGTARSKLGMFEGNLVDGELEIGQTSCLLHDILPASEIIHTIWSEFEASFKTPIKKIKLTRKN